MVRLELSEADAWRLLALLKRAAAADEADGPYWRRLAHLVGQSIDRARIARWFCGER